jgi:hypothetical protein
MSAVVISQEYAEVRQECTGGNRRTNQNAYITELMGVMKMM